MRYAQLRFVVPIICCIVALGCSGSSPTNPSETANSLEAVSSEAKGGGTPRNFDVTVSGDLSGSVSGYSVTLKERDHRLPISSFPMDIAFLQTAVTNGAICFADAQIDPAESLELRFSTPKQANFEVGAQYWFDGVSVDGENVLYRLVMEGSFVEGKGTWIGTAKLNFYSFSINGQLEGSKGGKNRKSVCQGSGAIAVTATIDEVG